jgi:nucleoside-diphosphate-sugar epimerase
VLVVSSSHVYAPVSPEHPHVTETAPVKPTGAYGVTKLQAEEVCRERSPSGST